MYLVIYLLMSGISGAFTSNSSRVHVSLPFSKSVSGARCMGFSGLKMQILHSKYGISIVFPDSR